MVKRVRRSRLGRDVEAGQTSTRGVWKCCVGVVPGMVGVVTSPKRPAAVAGLSMWGPGRTWRPGRI